MYTTKNVQIFCGVWTTALYIPIGINTHFFCMNNFIITMRLRLAEIKNNLRTSSGWGKRGNVLSWNFIESCKIVEQQQSWLLQPVGEDCERGQNAQCLVISTEIFSKYRRLGLFSMPCFSKRNKNKLRTNWGWSSQKIKNNKPRQNLLVHIKKIACT